MRLIDADKLIKDISYQYDMENLYLPINFIDFITEQPTAYDAGESVEQLKQQEEQYRRRAREHDIKGFESQREMMSAKACSYEHAIEIVKGGGTDV